MKKCKLCISADRVDSNVVVGMLMLLTFVFGRDEQHIPLVQKLTEKKSVVIGVDTDQRNALLSIYNNYQWMFPDITVSEITEQRQNTVECIVIIIHAF